MVESPGVRFGGSSGRPQRRKELVKLADDAGDGFGGRGELADLGRDGSLGLETRLSPSRVLRDDWQDGLLDVLQVGTIRQRELASTGWSL